jgi:hypothetical protein
MTSSTIGSSQSAKYCVGFVLLERKRRRRKTTTSFIRQNEKQYLEGTLALARHDPTLYCDFFEFCSANWKGGDREEKHKLIRK